MPTQALASRSFSASAASGERPSAISAAAAAAVAAVRAEDDAAAASAPGSPDVPATAVAPQAAAHAGAEPEQQHAGAVHSAGAALTSVAEGVETDSTEPPVSPTAADSQPPRVPAAEVPADLQATSSAPGDREGGAVPPVVASDKNSVPAEPPSYAAAAQKSARPGPDPASPVAVTIEAGEGDRTIVHLSSAFDAAALQDTSFTSTSTGATSAAPAVALEAGLDTVAAEAAAAESSFAAPVVDTAPEFLTPRGSDAGSTVGDLPSVEEAMAVAGAGQKLEAPAASLAPLGAADWSEAPSAAPGTGEQGGTGTTLRTVRRVSGTASPLSALSAAGEEGEVFTCDLCDVTTSSRAHLEVCTAAALCPPHHLPLRGTPCLRPHACGVKEPGPSHNMHNVDSATPLPLNVAR